MSEEKKVSQEEEFESKEITVARKGKTRTFVVKEISGLAFSRLAANLNHQDAAKQEQAREVFGANLIATTASENGEAISFDKACNLPSGIYQRLIQEANTLNGASEDQKAEAKNA